MPTSFFPSWEGGPFSEMRRLQDEVNRLLSSFQYVPAAASFPPVNAYANEDGIAITAQLPGVREQDLDISAFRDSLTLRGKREPAVSEAKAYHRRERGYGEFVRNISLPFRVDPDRVEATMHNGMLRISLYRPDEDKPKRIRVSS